MSEKEKFPEPDKAHDEFIAEALVEGLGLNDPSHTDKVKENSALREFCLAGGRFVEDPRIVKRGRAADDEFAQRPAQMEDEKSPGSPEVDRHERKPTRQEILDVIWGVAREDGVSPDELKIKETAETIAGEFVAIDVIASEAAAQRLGLKKCGYMYTAKGYRGSSGYYIDRVARPLEYPDQPDQDETVAMYEDGGWTIISGPEDFDDVGEDEGESDEESEGGSADWGDEK